RPIGGGHDRGPYFSGIVRYLVGPDLVAVIGDLSLEIVPGGEPVPKLDRGPKEGAAQVVGVLVVKVQDVLDRIAHIGEGIDRPALMFEIGRLDGAPSRIDRVVDIEFVENDLETIPLFQFEKVDRPGIDFRKADGHAIVHSQIVHGLGEVVDNGAPNFPFPEFYLFLVAIGHHTVPEVKDRIIDLVLLIDEDLGHLGSVLGFKDQVGFAHDDLPYVKGIPELFGKGGYLGVLHLVVEQQLPKTVPPSHGIADHIELLQVEPIMKYRWFFDHLQFYHFRDRLFLRPLARDHNGQCDDCPNKFIHL